MTLFIYEHLTSGALLNEPFSSGLMHEGDAMLTALSQDLLALGREIVLLRDARLPELPPHHLLTVHKVSTIEEYLQAWQHSLQTNTHIILIAPETDGVLYQLVTQLERHSLHHLGSGPTAIQLCSDKYQTYRQLSAQKIPTPVTQTVSAWLQSDHRDSLWIVKPRDGAGCEHTYKLNSSDLKNYVLGLSTEQQMRQIIQPYITGETLSLSLFISNAQTEILSVNRQHIKETAHQLSLSHCQPGCESLIPTEVTKTLIQQIRATIPGLWGFVGIDLIQADEQLWVIEINPRLTSSYAEPAFRLNRNPALALHQSIQP